MRSSERTAKFLRHCVMMVTFLISAANGFAQSPAFADLSVALPPEVRTNVQGAIRVGISLRNFGPDAATNVVVTASSTAGTVRFEGCTAATSGSCTISLLARSQFPVVTVLIDDPPAEGMFDVEVSVASSAQDPDPTNNRARTRVEVFRAPSLRFFIAAPHAADPGSAVEYTATVFNDSLFDATGISFSFVLPENWSYESSLSEELRCGVEGSTVRCVVDRLEGRRGRELRFRLRAPESREGSAEFRSVALTTDHGVFSTFSSPTMAWISFSTWRTFAVTNVRDSGEGSLREAILTANRESSSPFQQRKVVFEIPGNGSSHHTIEPLTPLPPIEIALTIDGDTQTARFGDTNPLGPEVEINGSRVTEGDGLTFRRSFALKSLIINGFPGNGVAVLTPFSSPARIEGCYIGTDHMGQGAVPNRLRGVLVNETASGSTGQWGSALKFIDNVISGNSRSGVFVLSTKGVTLRGNRIGAAAGLRLLPLRNGASGIYLGPDSRAALIEKNLVGFNGDAGIAIDRKASFTEIRANSILQNGSLAIDYGLDLVTPNVSEPGRTHPNFPVITSVVYDAVSGLSTIDGHLDEENFRGTIELFASNSADPSGFGEGESFLGGAEPTTSRTFRFVTPTDLRGRSITSTATRLHTNWDETNYLTSEFSSAFAVEGNAVAPIVGAEMLPRGADLSISLTGWPHASVTVRNAGPTTAENVAIELSADGGSFEHISISRPSCNGAGTASVRCVVSRLGPGEVVYLSGSLQPFLQQRRMAVHARVFSATEDPNLSNNQKSVSGELGAVLRVEVESPGAVDPGALAKYGVTVRHWSRVDASDVALSIPLPLGWTFVAGGSSGWACSTESPAIVCRKSLVEVGTIEEFEYTVRAPDSPFGTAAEAVVMLTIGGSPERTPGARVGYETFRVLEVTTTADAGDGSLRDAISRATSPWLRNKILFNMPLAESHDGVFTIMPRTPLPPIGGERYFGIVEIIVDGTTQTRKTGNTNAAGPEVVISGVWQSEGSGLVVKSDTVTIRGFVINGFPLDGVAILRARTAYLVDNFIGTDPGGRTAVPNGRRGVSLEAAGVRGHVTANVISGNVRSGVFAATASLLRISGNRIGLSAEAGGEPLPNGASGVYIGSVQEAVVNANAISHNSDAGVAISDDAGRVTMRGNSMLANGWLGIDYGLDGVTSNEDSFRPADLPPYPTLLSARWDATTQTTRVEGTIERSAWGGVVELFRNDSVDPSGYGEAGETVGEVRIEPDRSPGQQHFSIEIPRDMRGMFITATWTKRIQDVGWTATSEISAAIRVAE